MLSCLFAFPFSWIGIDTSITLGQASFRTFTVIRISVPIAKQIHNFIFLLTLMSHTHSLRDEVFMAGEDRGLQNTEYEAET
jgi:sporulation-control protein spo0M